MEKKVEEKFFRIEQIQNYLNNVVDGLVNDIIDIKKSKIE